MRFALLAAGFLALCPLARAAEPASICTASYADEHWRSAVKSFTADKIDDARTETDAMITACGESSLSYWPRLLRADIATAAKDSAKVLTLLAPVPRAGAQPLGKSASWLAMQANLALKDEATFLTERDALMKEVDRALTAPGNAARGTRRETFTVGDASVTAYDLDLLQGVFRRRYYFAILRKGAFYPESLMATIDGAVEFLEPNKKTFFFFVDAYYCAGHATVGNIVVPRKDGDGKPAYDEVKALATKYVLGQLPKISSTEAGGERCAFQDYMAPGLE